MKKDFRPIYREKFIDLSAGESYMTHSLPLQKYKDGKWVNVENNEIDTLYMEWVNDPRSSRYYDDDTGYTVHGIIEINLIEDMKGASKAAYIIVSIFIMLLAITAATDTDLQPVPRMIFTVLFGLLSMGVFVYQHIRFK